jgi:hypothetical protein
MLMTVFIVYQIEDVRAAKQSRFRSSKATREKERQVVVLPVLAGVSEWFSKGGSYRFLDL